ncbi:MAG: radical SAM family heme chaperone HemW, partial [Acetobacteraceae bacterium]
YAGIGPGAHGRVMVDGALRATRRHRAPEPWADRVERQGHGTSHDALVDSRDRAREMLIMGLRLAEGVDLTWFHQRTGVTIEDAVDADVMRMAMHQGYMTRTDSRLSATSEGRIRLDSLLGALVR